MTGCILMMCIGQVYGTWPMWGGTLTHESVQLMKGAITSPVIKWRFAQWAEWQFSAIADPDKDGQAEVVIGTLTPNVACLAGSTGIPEWQFAPDGQVYGSSPTIADLEGDGQYDVLVGDQAGKVYCLSGVNGASQWVFPTGAWVWSSPAVGDCDGDGQNEVVFGSEDCKVYCVSRTGVQEWSRSFPGWVRSSPVITDIDGDLEMEVLFGMGGAGTSNGLYSLNGVTGNTEWAFLTGNSGSIYSSPSVADLDGDGFMEAIIGAADGKVYCVRGSDGTQKWVFATAGTKVSSSAALADADADGIMEVFIGTAEASNDYNLYCLDGLTGFLQWSFNAKKEIHNPVSLADVDGDNRFEVLVGTHDHDTLYCVNAEDGSLSWKIRLSMDVHAPFVGDIDGDGCAEVVVGTSGGVYALDDPGNATGCGSVYTEEDHSLSSLEFRTAGKGLYLFMPREAQVSLSLYDVSGKLAQKLYEGVLSQGAHTFIPNLKVGGVYLAVLRYQGGMKTLKIVR